MDNTGKIWMLIIVILVIYLIASPKQRLKAAWQGLIGQGAIS